MSSHSTRTSHVGLDVEANYSHINGHKAQGTNSKTEDLATYLPTLLNGSTATSNQLALTKSTSLTSIDVLSSNAKTENNLIKSWAILLHLYAVSDAVCFVVSGQLRDNDAHTRSSAQLVTSQWSRPSSEQSVEPQLRLEPYVSSDHASKANTLVQFGGPDVVDKDFSYALQWNGRNSTDLCLHTNQEIVPLVFASSVWDTLLEVYQSVSHGLQLGVSLSAADQTAIRKEVQGTLFEERLCLHQLFQESVRLAPSAEAVSAWDGSLTYTALDQLSNVLAAQLIESSGVSPGKYVAFSFEKSMWMVVAVLGILKAGGAIVSIDPSQPGGRAEEILKEIKADVIVTSPKQASRFINLVPKVIQISSKTIHTSRNGSPTIPILPVVRPHSPAMVIFTSGSTGKPKGIAISHGASSTRMITEGKSLLYEGARTLQFAASTWDIFMTDIFTTLTYHGCVCVPSEEERRFNLAKFCKEKKVTLALITPSLADLLDPVDFPTLRVLIFGGEALRKDIARKWMNVKGLTLLQGYGPAETGFIIGTSKADVQFDERPEVLGYARGNSVCVLVDPENHDRLVPRGAVGELVVGGPTLFSEYLNAPEKSKAAVIQSPSWAADLGYDVKRFYKTGDLLHQSLDKLDGRMEFVGRKDDQVKFHGQRIELKEIEHHLRNLRGVENRVVSCVATLPKTGQFKDKLVAVVQCDTNNAEGADRILSIRHDVSLTASTVKKALSSTLPDYMIPSELLVVHQIPHNSAMKLDRARVNRWVSELQIDEVRSGVDLQLEGEGLLNQEATARSIAREYARLVSGNDATRRQLFENKDFNLQAGGIDSIQIISLSMFISKTHSVQVPMADILSSRATIRSIASIVDKKRVAGQKETIIDLASVESEINIQLQAIRSGALRSYSNSDVKSVFVTGGTGFLGIEIIHQLLTQSDCHVYALIRAPTNQEATERTVERAVEAGWWDESYLSRLHVWKGDLKKPQFGLTDTQLQMLRGQSPNSIDAIIHNGAKVHYNLDYDSLKATNVTPTVELLRLVNERVKPLKSFVFVSGGQQLSFNDAVDEENVTKALNGSGYARSKAVSELLVKRFASEQDTQKVKHIRVVKPGFIIGDADRGVANQTDFIWRLIAACVEIGYYSENDTESWLFISDVTRVSHSILDSVFQADTKPVVKVLDGIKFKDLWATLSQNFGYDLQPLRRQEWLSRIRQAVTAKQEAHVLFPLMYMLETSDEPIGLLNGPDKATDGVEAAIKANIRHLLKVGYLPQPSSVATPASSQDGEVYERDAFDVEAVRREFPALHQGVVAFNNAAGTALHKEAIEGTQKYMTAFPYELGRNDPHSQQKTEKLMSTYAELASFMNAEPDEVGEFAVAPPP